MLPDNNLTLNAAASTDILAKLAATTRVLETTLLVKQDPHSMYPNFAYKALLRLTVKEFGQLVHYQTITNHPGIKGVTHTTSTIAEALSSLSEPWRDSEPVWNLLTLAMGQEPVTNAECIAVAVRCWCEVLGAGSPDDPAALCLATTVSTELLQQQLIAMLTSGANGVKDWNQLEREYIRLARNFEKTKLSGKVLKGANLSLGGVLAGAEILDWSKSDFSKSDLADAILRQCILKQCKFISSDLTSANISWAEAAGAKFSKANLSKADMTNVRAQKADFTESQLCSADLSDANLTGAKIIGANLQSANLSNSDLEGVDFTGANLDGVVFKDASFNEKTVWPENFQVPWREMNWTGKGLNPEELKSLRAALPTTAMSMEEFYDELVKEGFADRLKKAVAMLKAESFQLFADVTDEQVIGVVKSQTNTELVYSCRLTSNGTYHCCSQNLFPCGGLRGAICKHLLVLLLGLVKSNQLSGRNANSWVSLSRIQQPSLDKDEASQTFIRYKGAESGEVDWRPTETIPEDYYSF